MFGAKLDINYVHYRPCLQTLGAVYKKNTLTHTLTLAHSYVPLSCSAITQRWDGGGGGREREGGGVGGGGAGRQTDRQTQIDSKAYRDRQTDRLTDTETERDRDRQTDRQAHTEAHRATDRKAK